MQQEVQISYILFQIKVGYWYLKLKQKYMEHQLKNKCSMQMLLSPPLSQMDLHIFPLLILPFK